MIMVACQGGCREELKARNFGLVCNQPELFVTSQWRDACLCPSWLYAVYRLLVAMFWLTVLVLSGILDLGWYSPDRDGFLWFAYLTNWALFVLTLDVTVQAITCLFSFVSNNCYDSAFTMPWYFKIQWLLSNISLGIGIAVTIASFVLFYSPQADIHYVDQFSHIGNTVYLFFNLFITAMPLRLYHAVYPIIFAVVYVFVSIAMNYAADISVYPGIDWSDAKTISICLFLCSILGIATLWLLLYGFYRLRLVIATALKRQTEHRMTIENNHPDIMMYYLPSYSASFGMQTPVSHGFGEQVVYLSNFNVYDRQRQVIGS